MRGVLALALLAVLALAGRPDAATVTVKEVEEALTCQCGCGLTVHSCNHLQCGSAIPLRREAAGAVAEGLDRDEILLRFRSKYGEKILSAPVAEGFNRSAWIAPFAALGLGAALVFVVISRWTTQTAEGAGGRSEGRLSDDERRRLDEELGRKEV